MQILAKTVYQTIAYFDIFDYPLTPFEAWKWLYFETPRPEKFSFSEVRICLDEAVAAGRLSCQHGFYFFPGRGQTVETRLRRYGQAEKKFHKAKRIIKILRLFPFIRMIAVCNTLAYSNSRRQGDIDLFIVTQRRRVWQARFWVAGFLKLFGLRPDSSRTEDTICPTFFVDEDNLNLEKLAIKNDIYLPLWVRQLVPVYDQGVYYNFLAANQWATRRLPNSLPVCPTSRRRIRPAPGGFKKTINYFCSFFPERFFRQYQEKVMPKKLKEMANQDSRVVLSEGLLKFHDNDRRRIFLEKWQEAVKNNNQKAWV